MTDREIMEQALDALDLLSRVPKAKRDYADRAIVALRERLAQPEQEPVSGVVLDEHGSAALVNNGAEEWHCKKHNARRLYTTPPQRKPEQEPVVKWDASAPLVVHPHPAFQAAPLQRKPEQELVIDCPRCGHCCPQRTWVGLTDEEKNDLSMEMVKAGKSVNWLTSRIEAKLKEKNNG